MLGEIRKRVPIRRRPEPKGVPGLPPTVDRALLDGLCVAKQGALPRRVYHQQLSAWKDTGAFRLIIELDERRDWTLVFKDARYADGRIPALKKLPALPGLPEHVVYGSADRELAAFIPTVYDTLEVDPRRHFAHYLGDLGPDYQKAFRVERRLLAAGRLRSVHRALRRWHERVRPEGLLRYDREFDERLLAWVAGLLLDDPTPSREAQALRSEWHTVEAAARRFALDDPAQPIHGDFNGANVYVGPKGRDLRVIDWEWAGLGHAQADLAALLKGADAGTEQEAVRLAFSTRSSNDLADHEARYAWCKLQRNLIDFGFWSEHGRLSDDDARVDAARMARQAAEWAAEACCRLAPTVGTPGARRSA